MKKLKSLTPQEAIELVCLRLGITRAQWDEETRREPMQTARTIVIQLLRFGFRLRTCQIAPTIDRPWQSVSYHLRKFRTLRPIDHQFREALNQVDYEGILRQCPYGTPARATISDFEAELDKANKSLATALAEMHRLGAVVTGLESAIAETREANPSLENPELIYT